MSTSTHPRQLNVGCGPDIKAGWLNVDVRAGEGVDVVCSADDLPFEDASFDTVLAHDVIEHLGRDRSRVALREFHRLLVPGGMLYICCPDLSQIARAYARGQINDARLECLLYGRQEFPENTHRCGYTPATLKTACLKAGFASVERWRRTNVSPHNQSIIARKAH